MIGSWRRTGQTQSSGSGGYGERVEDPAELPAALARAVRAVTDERRQALLNVICDAPGGPL